MGADRCFVVDGMNLAYSSYYANSSLRYMGKSTSMLFGVPNQIKSLINMEKIARVIVCWDGEKNPERLRLLPEYKSHRKANLTDQQRANFHKQIRRLRKLLYYLGLPQVYNPAMEGDDAIYWVVKSCQHLYDVRIISSDKDFGQLINKDVSVWKPRNKYCDTWQTFFLDYKVEVHQYVDYLCLTGDDSDDIPGYRGIGPARASAFLGKFGSIKAYLKDRKAEFSGLNDKEKLREIWKRNRMLIDLAKFNETHHKLSDVLYFKDKKLPKFQREKFIAYAKTFNMKTFLTEQFQKPFIQLQDE